VLRPRLSTSHWPGCPRCAGRGRRGGDPAVGDATRREKPQICGAREGGAGGASLHAGVAR
jgi:hypothetical protein